MCSINDLKKKLSFDKVVAITVNSSNLSTIAYNPQNKTLTILFKRGTIYKYFNVEKSVVYKLLDIKLKNESVGIFFRNYIMNNYKFSRLNSLGEIEYTK